MNTFQSLCLNVWDTNHRVCAGAGLDLFNYLEMMFKWCQSFWMSMHKEINKAVSLSEDPGSSKYQTCSLCGTNMCSWVFTLPTVTFRALCVFIARSFSSHSSSYLLIIELFLRFPANHKSWSSRDDYLQGKGRFLLWGGLDFGKTGVPQLTDPARKQ